MSKRCRARAARTPAEAPSTGSTARLTIFAHAIRLQTQVDEAASLRMALDQDQQISRVVSRERSRLLNFIRRRVPDPLDAEDILQDVFYALVEANRLLMPVEHVTGWLFSVERNRITALFRK